RRHRRPGTRPLADAVRPAVRPLPDAATQALGALVTRRHQLVEMLTAEENRRKTASTAIRSDIQVHIAWLRKRQKGVDKELSQAVRTSPLWREQEVCRALAPSSASRC